MYTGPTKLEAGQMCEGIRTDVTADPNVQPWTQKTLSGVTTFEVVIGPSGGDRGYSAWTGTKKIQHVQFLR